jgi:hypothetical protein
MGFFTDQECAVVPAGQRRMGRLRYSKVQLISVLPFAAARSIKPHEIAPLAWF